MRLCRRRRQREKRESAATSASLLPWANLERSESCLFIHFVSIADNFTSFFVFGSLSCPFRLHECARSVKKAWVGTFSIHTLYTGELWSIVVALISIQGPFDGVSVRGQLFCPKHSHLPFPLPKVVKNLTVPERDTNANSFVNYASPPEGLRLFSAQNPKTNLHLWQLCLA